MKIFSIFFVLLHHNQFYTFYMRHVGLQFIFKQALADFSDSGDKFNHQFEEALTAPTSRTKGNVIGNSYSDLRHPHLALCRRLHHRRNRRRRRSWYSSHFGRLRIYRGCWPSIRFCWLPPEAGVPRCSEPGFII